MIDSIELLKSEIIGRGLARVEELSGCTHEAIERLNKKYGQLPLAYQQIVQLLGYGAGKWLCDCQYDYDVRRAVELTDWMRDNNEILDEFGKPIERLKNVFFMSGRYALCGGGGMKFIEINNNTLDSPVYSIDHHNLYENDEEWLDTIELDYRSIWDWIESIVDRAEQRMIAIKSAKLEYERLPFFKQLSTQAPSMCPCLCDLYPPVVIK